MRVLRIDNYIITTPLIDIITQLRLTLTNGKLKEVKAWHVGDDNIVVTCPHHSGGHESHAACNIYVGENSKIEYGYFRCWVCDAQGSFVRFVQECFECSEDYAKHWLTSRFGAVCERTVLMDDNIVIKKTLPGVSRPTLLKDQIDTYQSWHPYLAKRKLARDVCELFQVKYDPYLRQVVFPCFNLKGDLIMAPRRSIDTKTFYIDKDIEKPVYCLDFIQKNNIHTALLTEGPFDCLTAYSYGYPAIATWGNPSPEQINAINRSCLKTIYLAFDNDQAGQRFSRILKSGLSSRILIKEVQLPSHRKDLNDLTFEEFTKVMETAKKS